LGPLGDRHRAVSKTAPHLRVFRERAKRAGKHADGAHLVDAAPASHRVAAQRTAIALAVSPVHRIRLSELSEAINPAQRAYIAAIAGACRFTGGAAHCIGHGLLRCEPAPAEAAARHRNADAGPSRRRPSCERLSTSARCAAERGVRIRTCAVARRGGTRTGRATSQCVLRGVRTVQSGNTMIKVGRLDDAHEPIAAALLLASAQGYRSLSLKNHVDVRISEIRCGKTTQTLDGLIAFLGQACDDRDAVKTHRARKALIQTILSLRRFKEALSILRSWPDAETSGSRAKCGRAGPRDGEPPRTREGKPAEA
jgi:hypothetical protein